MPEGAEEHHRRGVHALRRACGTDGRERGECDRQGVPHGAETKPGYPVIPSGVDPQGMRSLAIHGAR